MLKFFLKTFTSSNQKVPYYNKRDHFLLSGRKFQQNGIVWNKLNEPQTNFKKLEVYMKRLTGQKEKVPLKREGNPEHIRKYLSNEVAELLEHALNNMNIN